MMCLVLLVDEVVHWNSSLALPLSRLAFYIYSGGVALAVVVGVPHSPNPPAREREARQRFLATAQFLLCSLFPLPSLLSPFSIYSGRRQCTSTAAKVCAIISLLLGEAAAASW